MQLTRTAGNSFGLPGRVPSVGPCWRSAPHAPRSKIETLLCELRPTEHLPSRFPSRGSLSEMSNPDRRRAQHIALRQAVSVVIGNDGHDVPALTDNLSSAGVLLYADRFIQEGSEVGLILVVPPLEMVRKIATVQAHAFWAQASVDDFFDGSERVIGVHQQHGMVGKELLEAAERLFLVAVGHHKGVRQSAEGGNAEAGSCIHVRCACAAADVRGARGEHTGLGPVRAATAELDNAASPGCGDHACGLGRNHRLEGQCGQQEGLDNLCFDDGSGDTQQRFLTEDGRAFGNGPDFPRGSGRFSGSRRKRR
jgi:hypothetical protein